MWRPAPRPKRNWPGWPVSTGPMSWPSWPTSSPTASTPTATSPTSTAPNAAALCIGRQDIDGMSAISGWLTPEARATIGCGASPNSPPPACATPPMRRPASAAPPHKPPSRATPAAWPTQPRRATGRGPRTAGLRGPRSTQRATCQHHRHHHVGGTRSRRRPRAHRRRHTAADVGCDPAGLPRPPLPGDLRQRQSPGALSHQTPGLTGPTNCVARQRPRVHIPRLHRARPTCARSTTSTPTPSTRSPTSTASR